MGRRYATKEGSGTTMQWIKCNIKKSVSLSSHAVFGIVICFQFIPLFYYRSIINFEDRIVKENDNVLMANVLYDEGTIREKLTVLITFKNNQWIVLGNIRIKNDNDNVSIINICGYDIHTSERITDEEGNFLIRWVNFNIAYTLSIQLSVQT